MLDAPAKFNIGRSSHMKVNEFRISNVARSGDWIRTEYNISFRPQTFCVARSV